MTDQQLEAYKQLLREHGARNSETAEKARASLVRAGTHDREGRLTPEYGGAPAKEPPRR
ncbi:MAG: hypothetical protein ACFE0R_12610 [Salinarimonas sp.]